MIFILHDFSYMIYIKVYKLFAANKFDFDSLFRVGYLHLFSRSVCSFVSVS